MKKLIISLIVLVVLVGSYFWFNRNQARVDPLASNLPASTTPVLMQPSSQLFADSRFSQSAYQIFPGKLSAAAQTALDGFDLKINSLGNNIFQVVLIAKKAEYQNQTLVVSGDQKVYFIEASRGDDTPGEDRLPGDDQVVAVDAQGYILR